MALDDRTRWNQRYQDPEESSAEPSRVLTSLADRLPVSGSALDLAGGAGRHAIWLAQRGLAARLTDVSDAALRIAQDRAHEAGVQIHCEQRDLLAEGLPTGAFDLIVSCLFLDRDLLAETPAALQPEGLFVMLQPTQKNRTRHRRPPERYLLEEGELPRLLTDVGLAVILYREGWLEDGRHDAVAIARRAEPQ